jgi:hypothetical protein
MIRLFKRPPKPASPTTVQLPAADDLPNFEPKFDQPSVFAMSLVKSGSTLLNDALRHLSPLVPIEFRSVDDELFQRNIRIKERPDLLDANLFRAHGFCYGGFRSWPPYKIPSFESHKTVLLVRDPRDIVVSQYFSVSRSHIVPEGDQRSGAAARMLADREKASEVTVDEYAREKLDYTARVYGKYIKYGVHKMPNVKLYRYEDVIYQKAQWLQSIADWFDWQIAEGDITRIANLIDIIPDSEDQEAHVRQVHPGNHRRHLQPQTIELYRRECGPLMREYGYEDI